MGAARFARRDAADRLETVAVFGLNLAVTVFYIPHQALGAELTTDTHAVSRVFAWRQAAIYVGMIGFGLNAEKHAEVRRALDARKAAAPSDRALPR